jgi:hypothetical protein
MPMYGREGFGGWGTGRTNFGVHPQSGWDCAAMATQTPSEEDPTYFSGLVLQQKWEGCLEFMWAKCGE